jgi:hypothetical protein
MAEPVKEFRISIAIAKRSGKRVGRILKQEDEGAVTFVQSAAAATQ